MAVAEAPVWIEERLLSQFRWPTPSGDRSARRSWSSALGAIAAGLVLLILSAYPVTLSPPQPEQELTGTRPTGAGFKGAAPSGSEGRTLRPQIVTIHDPVVGETVTLDPEARTARKMPRSSFDVHRLGDSGKKVIVKTRQIHGVESHEEIMLDQGNRTAAVSIRKIRKAAPVQVDENVRTEELGSRNFGDVLAEGTRTVSIIPSGAIGNELPIEVVSERWYSSDLQIVLMSRRYDPRFGETVYELRNLAQTEPDPGLFEVPEDYSVDSWTPAGAEFYSGTPSGIRKRVKRIRKSDKE